MAKLTKQLWKNPYKQSLPYLDFPTVNDVEALRSRIPPPKDEQTKQKVAAIREKLAKVEALEKTGRYSEGLTLAKKLRLEVQQVDYRPVQAEVLYWLGNIYDRVGEHKKGIRSAPSWLSEEDRNAISQFDKSRTLEKKVAVDAEKAVSLRQNVFHYG